MLLLAALIIVIGGLACELYGTPWRELRFADIEYYTKRLDAKGTHPPLLYWFGLDEKWYSRVLGTYDGRIVESTYVCFGDVCPDNSRHFLRYKGIDSPEACDAIGGDPVIGYSWGQVYAGCGIEVFSNSAREKRNE